MAKVKNFKTIFPAVSVPLNEDYSINEPEFRAYCGSRICRNCVVYGMSLFYNGEHLRNRRRCEFDYRT